MPPESARQELRLLPVPTEGRTRGVLRCQLQSQAEAVADALRSGRTRARQPRTRLRFRSIVLRFSTEPHCPAILEFVA